MLKKFKFETIYNDYTNVIVDEFLKTIEKKKLPSQMLIDTADICHLLGKIQYQQEIIDFLIGRIPKLDNKTNYTLNSFRPDLDKLKRSFK